MDAKLVALKLVLSELGIAAEQIETVNDRKRVQKAVYLGQLSGIDLGYRYGWYLMGPYSPSLTRDYYDLAESISEGDRDFEDKELTSAVRERLSEIKPIMSVPAGVTLEPEDWLELISSFHFLTKASGYDRDKINDALNREKPHVARYAEEAQRVLTSAGLL